MTFLFRTSDGIRLEGAIHTERNAPGVVLSHPHPLHGGDMDNPVVLAMESAYRKKGYTTLRFNFRGVGKSDGKYTGGTGEREDVQTAAAVLRQNGAARIELAGYSFGAWVNAHSVGEIRADRMIMVSPPLAMMNFSNIGRIDCLQLVITGEYDDIAPAAMIRKNLPLWNPDAALAIIGGADHFFTGAAKEPLVSILEKTIS